MKAAPTLLTTLALAAIYSALGQVPGGGVFQRFDKNGDGKVTKDELPNADTFARFDVNKDGAITLEEYDQVAGGMKPKPDAPPVPVKPGETPPATPTPATAQAPSVSQIDAIVKAVDKNGDGKVTKEEAAGAKWFDRLDQNADGVIDAEELAMVRKIIARGGAAGGGRGMPSDAPALTPDDLKKVTSGPEILKPGDVGIGRMLPDAAFTDLAGKAHRLSELKAHKGVVIPITSATCPVSKRYLPSLAKLEKELSAQGIALLLVNPFASEKMDDIKAQIAGLAFTGPNIHDKDKTLTAALQARTTTEVFLLDATRTLTYRYLADAIAALLKGETPHIAATAGPG